MEAIPQKCEAAEQAPRPRLAVRRGVAWMWALIVVAMLVRIAVAAASIGTNDALTFTEFGKEVRMVGVVATYRLDSYYNHPPLVGFWAATVLRLLRAPAVPLQLAFRPSVTHAFSFVFKLPIIAADALAAWVLFKRWTPRLGDVRAAAVAACFAWAPGSILIGAFHCNTDPAYAALCLAAIFLLEEERAFFWGGLALGAAVNVKIIPLLLVPPLLLRCSTRQETRAFVLGLSAAAVPFLPAVCRDFASFHENVLAYNPSTDAWGLNLFLMLGMKTAGLAWWAERLLDWYHKAGRYVLLALIFVWAVLARRRQRWNRYELAAATMAIFVVFTPGFGVQYIVPVGLLLFAVRPRVAAAYAIAVGAFLLEVYIARSDGLRFPILVLVYTRLSTAEALLGLPAWGILVYFLVTTVFRRPIEPNASVKPNRTTIPISRPALPAAA